MGWFETFAFASSVVFVLVGWAFFMLARRKLRDATARLTEASDILDKIDAANRKGT